MKHHPEDMLVLFHDHDSVSYRKKLFDKYRSRYRVEIYFLDREKGTFTEREDLDHLEEVLAQAHGLIISG